MLLDVRRPDLSLACEHDGCDVCEDPFCECPHHFGAAVQAPPVPDLVGPPPPEGLVLDERGAFRIVVDRVLRVRLAVLGF